MLSCKYLSPQIYYAINSAKSQWNDSWHDKIFLEHYIINKTKEVYFMARYKRIRDLREDADMTQQQIADMLFINRRTYSSYEIGVHNTPPEILSDLADIHKTSVDYIMGRTDVKIPYPKSK